MRIDDLDKEFREMKSSLAEADALFKGGEFERALSLYKRALQLLEKSYGAHHIELLPALKGAGDSAYHLHSHEEAVALYKKLIYISQKHEEIPQIDFLPQMIRLGKSQRKTPQYKQAEETFRSAAQLAESSLAPGHQMLVQIYDEFAQVLKQVGKPQEAAKISEKAGLHREQSANPKAQYIESLKERAPRELPLGDAHAPLRSLRSHDGEGLVYSIRRSIPNNLTVFSVPLLLFALALGMTYFVIVSRAQWPKATWARPPGVPAEMIGVKYSSCDGIKTLRFVNKTNVDLTMKGTLIHATVDASTPTISGEAPVERRLTKVPEGLKDADGTILYAPNAPELLIYKKMMLGKTAAQEYYKTRYYYPPNLLSMKVAAPALVFESPITKQTNVLTYEALPGSEAQPKALQWGSFEECLRQTPYPLQNARTHTAASPGEIEFVSISYGASNAETKQLFIRAFDRNGQILTGSAGTPIIVVLQWGQEQASPIVLPSTPPNGRIRLDY